MPALDRSAVASGLTPAAPDPVATEELLRRAGSALGDEETGEAAIPFGLLQGTNGRRPTDLRE